MRLKTAQFICQNIKPSEGKQNQKVLDKLSSLNLNSKLYSAPLLRFIHSFVHFAFGFRVQHGKFSHRDFAIDGSWRRKARTEDVFPRGARRQNHLSAAAQENATRNMRQMLLTPRAQADARERSGETG